MQTKITSLIRAIGPAINDIQDPVRRKALADDLTKLAADAMLLQTHTRLEAAELVLLPDRKRKRKPSHSRFITRMEIV